MSETSYAEQQSLSSIVTEIKGEVQEFIQTRIRLAGSELSESVSTLKKLAVWGGIAAVFLSIGFLWLLYALTAWIALAFTDPAIRWPAAFGIVGVALLAVGGLVLMMAGNARRMKSLFPKKTIEVLRADTELWSQWTERP